MWHQVCISFTHRNLQIITTRCTSVLWPWPRQSGTHTHTHVYKRTGNGTEPLLVNCQLIWCKQRCTVTLDFTWLYWNGRARGRRKAAKTLTSENMHSRIEWGTSWNNPIWSQDTVGSSPLAHTGKAKGVSELNKLELHITSKNSSMLWLP